MNEQLQASCQGLPRESCVNQIEVSRGRTLHVGDTIYTRYSGDWYVINTIAGINKNWLGGNEVELIFSGGSSQLLRAAFNETTEILSAKEAEIAKKSDDLMSRAVRLQIESDRLRRELNEMIERRNTKLELPQ